MSALALDLLPVPGGVDPYPGRVNEEMAVERLRIAFAVNDTVIRHLFSIGLTLHATRTMVPDVVQIRLDATIDELDGVIHELRSLIFDLAGRCSR